MMIQTIARKVAGLPVTLLELNTLVHIGCAIILYLLWWCKPQDVSEPIVFDFSRCQQCKDKLTVNSFSSSGVVTEMGNANVVALSLGKYDDNFNEDVLSTFVLGGLCLLYGGIHAIAWNAHFPSFAEQMIWRVSVCIIGGGGLLWLHMRRMYENPLIFDSRTIILVVWLMIYIYILARIFIVTEAFISVRSLPVGAYDTVKWVNFLPHIG